MNLILIVKCREAKSIQKLNFIIEKKNEFMYDMSKKENQWVFKTKRDAKKMLLVTWLVWSSKAVLNGKDWITR